MTGRRFALVIVGVVAVLMAVVLVKASLIAFSGNRKLGAPATSALLPLPSGATVVANRIFGSEGSLGADLRVIAFETATGQLGEDGADAYMDGLSDLGWKRFPKGALSPDTKICLSAVPLNGYLADPEGSDQVKQVLRALDRPPERIGVISAGFC